MDGSTVEFFGPSLDVVDLSFDGRPKVNNFTGCSAPMSVSPLGWILRREHRCNTLTTVLSTQSCTRHVRFHDTHQEIIDGAFHRNRDLDQRFRRWKAFSIFDLKERRLSHVEFVGEDDLGPSSRFTGEPNVLTHRPRLCVGGAHRGSIAIKDSIHNIFICNSLQAIFRKAVIPLDSYIP